MPTCSLPNTSSVIIYLPHILWGTTTVLLVICRGDSPNGLWYYSIIGGHKLSRPIIKVYSLSQFRITCGILHFQGGLCSIYCATKFTSHFTSINPFNGGIIILSCPLRTEVIHTMVALQKHILIPKMWF